MKPAVGQARGGVVLHAPFDMMRLRTMMQSLTAVVSAIVAALVVGSASPVAAQDRPDLGTLQLSVLDARTDAPLAYAVVRVERLALERFTDARGRITIPTLTPGGYDIVVRRLGFLPLRVQVTVSAGAATVFDARMTRVPQVLTRMDVNAERACATPGAPDAVRQPEVAALVSLLRENADRYGLLVKQYPFVRMQARALGDLRSDAAFVQVVDVTAQPSKTKAEYRAGNVVKRSGTQYSMALPTILDLADDRFTRSHCYFYGGATRASSPSGDETWLRLDVRADDKLDAPDVHGSFYLDSATAQLRKMDLELSRPDKLPKRLATIGVVRVSTRFVEIASGIAVIESVCAVTRLRPSEKVADSVSRALVPIELQQLVSYMFETPPPDVPARREFESPAWSPQTYVATSAVWCES